MDVLTSLEFNNSKNMVLDTRIEHFLQIKLQKQKIEHLYR